MPLFSSRMMARIPVNCCASGDANGIQSRRAWHQPDLGLLFSTFYVLENQAQARCHRSESLRES